jgi:hypothetical protein
MVCNRDIFIFYFTLPGYCGTIGLSPSLRANVIGSRPAEIRPHSDPHSLFFLKPFLTLILSCKAQNLMWPDMTDNWSALLFRSRNSAVGINDWLRDGRLRGRCLSPGRVKNFLFSKSTRPALRSRQPSTQWVSGAKWPVRQADHSLLASAEIKKIWIYTSTPPYVFNDVALN